MPPEVFLLLLNTKRYSNTRKSTGERKNKLLVAIDLSLRKSLTLALDCYLLAVCIATFRNGVCKLLSLLYYLLGRLLTFKHLNLLHLI